MGDQERKESLAITEQDDNEDEDNAIEHEEAQENDETTLDDQYRDSQNNNEAGLNAATGDARTEAVMGSANDVVPTEETAQATHNTARPAQLEFNIEVMTEDPNAGPGLEEQLGGVVVGEVESPNGVGYLLVMLIDVSSEISPEL